MCLGVRAVEPHSLEGLLLQPVARALLVGQYLRGRHRESREPCFEVVDLRDHLFRTGARALRFACSELAAHPSKPVVRVDREPQQPAIPVTERDAVDFAPRLGPRARSVVEGTFTGAWRRPRQWIERDSAQGRATLSSGWSTRDCGRCRVQRRRWCLKVFAWRLYDRTRDRWGARVADNERDRGNARPSGVAEGVDREHRSIRGCADGFFLSDNAIGARSLLPSVAVLAQSIWRRFLLFALVAFASIRAPRTGALRSNA